jgi:hypothetical protein
MGADHGHEQAIMEVPDQRVMGQRAISVNRDFDVTAGDLPF